MSVREMPPCRGLALGVGVAAALVVASCRAAPPPPRAPKGAHCSSVRESGPPTFVSEGRIAEGGVVSAAYEAPAGFDASLSNVRVVSTLAMSSGGTVVQQAANTSDAHPLPCVFTAVAEDTTCVLVANGKRHARRQLVQSLGRSAADDVPSDAPWTLVLDLDDPEGCTKHPSFRGDMVLVEGARPDLRVVHFDMIVSYAGSDGSSGPLKDYRGADLRPEIERWPADERARYARGAGFEASRTRAGDLFWFTSMSDTSSPWMTRLRTATGAVLPVEREGSGRVTLLREGERLYWKHGELSPSR